MSRQALSGFCLKQRPTSGVVLMLMQTGVRPRSAIDPEPSRYPTPQTHRCQILERSPTERSNGLNETRSERLDPVEPISFRVVFKQLLALLQSGRA
ncbi:MAG: hypothetical protein OXC02_11115 [Rhodobacteraceae bacterium]|nr:hypothetical protein [Paracoccaceae bacterium]